MNPITILLIVIVAFLAGMEGILDEFEFHQPLVACTLIGLVSGHLTEGIMLGGSLQLMALGWANIDAPPSTTTIDDSSFSSAVKTRPFSALRPLASKNFSSHAMMAISAEVEVELDTLDQAA